LRLITRPLTPALIGARLEMRLEDRIVFCGCEVAHTDVYEGG